MIAKKITRVAIVAATYTALNFVLMFPLGPVQFRGAEGLCLLPMLFPETVWGITLGCFLSNLFVGNGVWDVVFGTLATLIAGLITVRIKNKWLAPLPAILCNSVILGAVFTLLSSEASQLTVFLIYAAELAAGEAFSCYLFGIPLISMIKKDKA